MSHLKGLFHFLEFPEDWNYYIQLQASDLDVGSGDQQEEEETTVVEIEPVDDNELKKATYTVVCFNHSFCVSDKMTLGKSQYPYLFRIRGELFDPNLDGGVAQDEREWHRIKTAKTAIERHFKDNEQIQTLWVGMEIGEGFFYFDFYSNTNNYLEEETEVVMNEIQRAELKIPPPVPHRSPSRPMQENGKDQRRTTVLQVYCGADPEWEYFKETLWPTESARRWMLLRDLCLHHVETGGNLNAPRRVEHLLAFGDNSCRSAAARWLQEEGFETLLSIDFSLNTNVNNQQLTTETATPELPACSVVLKVIREDPVYLTHLFFVVEHLHRVCTKRFQGMWRSCSFPFVAIE